MTKDQRELLRRVDKRFKYHRDTLDALGMDIDIADLAALLSLCAELGGAKDRAEFYREHAELLAMCKTCITKSDQVYRPDRRHPWDDARWAEEWKKREMEG